MPTGDIDARIARVRQELTALRERPAVRAGLARLDEIERSGLGVRERAAARAGVVRALGHLGVEHHRYELRPPLSEEQVAAYEHRNGVRLPADYRAFITRVANGGAGPSFYRLLPLDPERVSPGLHRPFPFRPDTLPDLMWDDDQGYWEFDESPFCPEHWCGAIFLTDEGCTFYQLLVVTGPQRGRIVHVDTDRNDWPMFDRAPDFLTWYGNWLFRRERPRRGTDDVGAARAALATGDAAMVEDAVRACYRLVAPHPPASPEAIAVLAEGVRSAPTAVARGRAVWALAHASFLRRELAGARGLVVPALTDPDPDVRALAVRYAELDGAALRAHLADPAPRVVAAALPRLAGLGEHHLDVLRRLLTDPAPARRIAGAEAGLSAYRFHDWDLPGVDAIRAELGDLFAAALDDPAPRVRAAAVVVLAVRDPDRARPALLAAAHDRDDDVRFRAVQALRRHAADPGVRARLQALAAADASRAVRIEAHSQLDPAGGPA